MKPYTYNAIVQEVIDADTFRLTVDLGFHIQTNLLENPVRLAGIDVPEIGTEQGQKATNFVKGRMAGREVLVHTIKTGRYGRWLARINHPEWEDELTTLLLKRGYYKVNDPYGVDHRFMPEGFVNINTSHKIELQWLPGIGPVTAQKILEARPFENQTDLLDVDGIGEQTYESIHTLLSV
jgi:competence protein ComEA